MPTARCLLRKNRAAARNARFIERPQFPPEKIQPATDLTDKAQRHDALRLHPEIRIAVTLRHRLPRDFQNMPEAVGDDQAEACDLALQQRVGCNRGAVGQHRQIVDAGAAFTEDGVTPRTNAIAGFGGVDDTFVTRIAPEASSTQTMSVKVPPVSMPIRSVPLLILECSSAEQCQRPVLCIRNLRVLSISFGIEALINLQTDSGVMLKRTDGVGAIT